MSLEQLQAKFEECLQEAPQFATAFAVALHSGRIHEGASPARVPDCPPGAGLDLQTWESFSQTRWAEFAFQNSVAASPEDYRFEGQVVRRPAPTPAIFLDRDGTMIDLVPYLKDPTLVRLKPGIAELIRWGRSQGFLFVCVTNQSGLGRGFYELDDFRNVQQRVYELLDAQSLNIDATYFSGFYAKSESYRWRALPNLRKPNLGMVTEAAAELNIDIDRSFMVGDSMADLDLGLASGQKATFILRGSHEEAKVDVERIPTAEALSRPGVIQVSNLTEVIEHLKRISGR